MNIIVKVSLAEMRRLCREAGMPRTSRAPWIELLEWWYEREAP